MNLDKYIIKRVYYNYEIKITREFWKDWIGGIMCFNNIIWLHNKGFSIEALSFSLHLIYIKIEHMHLQYHLLFAHLIFILDYITNKPTAQAAGAAPSQCNFTNRQNPLIQQNCRNFWPSNAI